MDLSRIAMLLALTGFIVVMLSFVGFGSFMDSSFPWILFGLAFFFFTKKRGCSWGGKCTPRVEKHL